MLEAKSEVLRIAVVEDDPLILGALTSLAEGHEVVPFRDAAAFLDSPESMRKNWDLLLLDLCHAGDPTGSGTVSRIPELKRRLRGAELVIQSGLADIHVMRACVRSGASKFVLKERIGEEIPALLARHLEIKAQRAELDLSIVGTSDAVSRMKTELLSLKHDTNADVLIEGETGSGKELCAKALHGAGPLNAVNVSAIPAELFEAEFFGADRGAFTGSVQSRMGHFESAGTGILFLDEIQSLSPAHQAKLLRVLEARTFARVGSSQERPFRARVVSASNRNLREAVSKGHFREDLYYRIATLSLQVPPLRVRTGDVELLAKKFLQEFDPAGRHSFTSQGMSFLSNSYDWPGNVRELRGLVRSLTVKSPIPYFDTPEIRALLGALEAPKFFDKSSTPEQVPAARTVQSTEAHAASAGASSSFAIQWELGFDANVERLEKFMLEETLRNTKSVDAREKLRLARSRFYEKLKQYSLGK